MKRFITVLMSAMIALSMMPTMAFAAISASESVDISNALSFLKSNLYNSSSLTASSTYSVATADELIAGDLKGNYYVKVATVVDDDVKSIKCGNNEFDKDKTFRLSVGNNVFIEDKAFYVDKDSLYVATVLVAPRNSILVNGSALDLKLKPTTTSLTASRIEKWNSGGELSVTKEEGNTCTVEASGNNVTGALYIGLNGVDSGTMLITEKTYKNGSTAYGLTGTDRQGDEYGLAFYPFGWGTDLTNPQKVTAYDGNSLDYSIYAVGKGVCNVSVNYKVGGVKAEVNGVKYASLETAIAAAENGQTIKLLDDVITAKRFLIEKDLTIDLNNHSISGDDCFTLWVKSGNVTLTGKGTVQVINPNNIGTNQYVIFLGFGAKGTEAALTIGQYVTVLSPKPIGVSVYGPDQEETLNVYGTICSTGPECAISTNGTDYSKATINIYEGANIISKNSTGIYVPSSKNVNIYGGNITGYDSAIGMKEGALNIYGGTLNATGEAVIPPEGYSNGINGSGAAIQIESNDAYKLNSETSGTVEVTVSGGVIKSEQGYGIYEYLAKKGDSPLAANTHLKSVSINGGQILGKAGSVLISKEAADKKVVSATGGTFSSNPKAYVPTGTNTYHQKTGKYFVGSMPSSTSGYNAWALQNGVYEETYVAPAEPETPDAPVIDNSGSGDNASTNVDASGSTVVTDGKAEVSIDSTTGDKIVENAKENNVADVVIKAETEKGDSTGSTVALPESTVQALAKDTEASVTIKTDSATVTLDKDAVKATAAQAGDSGEVKLEVVTVENTEDTLKVELKLVTSKGTVSDFQGGNVTVTVPVDPELAKKEIVCVYIDDNDKYTMMEGSLSSDGKSYTFTTGHFSTYAILEKAKADEIIADQNKPSDIASAKVTGVVNKTYTGKSITQNPVVTVGESKLVKGTDYTVSYKNNVNAGVATLTIKGAGSYTGTITKTFKINPKGTSISKVTGQKKAVKVVWKKQLTKMKSSYISGYQVQYSTSSKFTSGTSKYTNAKFSKGRTTKTIKNLKAGKKYYVRVRTYKTVDGTKCYSSWSKAKSVKTK